MKMNKILLILFIAATISGCHQTSKSDEAEKNGPVMDTNPEPDQRHNILNTLTDQDQQDLRWLNPPERFTFKEGALEVTVAGKTDFFNNPENGDITASAPLLYREVTGDFVATALVKPSFDTVWNAACLMVHADSSHWIKLAFENSDATGPSIVTVVTNGVSDDANGAILNGQKSVWLRLIRKGDLYALHWSVDGQEFKMARLCRMPPAAAIKVGMEAQSPVGEATSHSFLFFSLENKTVKDLRKGM